MYNERSRDKKFKLKERDNILDLIECLRSLVKTFCEGMGYSVERLSLSSPVLIQLSNLSP